MPPLSYLPSGAYACLAPVNQRYCSHLYLGLYEKEVQPVMRVSVPILFCLDRPFRSHIFCEGEEEDPTKNRESA